MIRIFTFIFWRYLKWIHTFILQRHMEMNTHIHSLETHGINTHIHSLDTRETDSHIHPVDTRDEYTIYSLEAHVMNTHIHSLEAHVMHIHVHSLDIHVMHTHMYSSGTPSMNTQIHLEETHDMNTQIHFLHNQQMNTQIHSLVINKGERENIGSNSKSVAQNYLFPISAISLVSTSPPHSALPWFARHLRSVWHLYSSWQLWSAGQLLSSILSLLDNLSRPGSFAWLGNFILLLNFAPLGLCSAFFSSLCYSLEGIRYLSAPHSQISALLRLHCVLLSARTTSCSLLAPSCVLRLYCASLASQCLLYFLVVSLCHTECSRSNTHSSPQPLTEMRCQPVLGSLLSVTPGLVTPGTPLCTFHSAPLAPPTWLLKTSTTRICI